MKIKFAILFPVVALILSACVSAPSASKTGQSEVAGTSHTLMPTATPGSMSPEGMGGHMMEPIGGEHVEQASETTGGQPLSFTEENGVKVFELTTKAVLWTLTNDVAVTALTYNGTVPGPEIRVTEGDQVRVVVKNALEEPTTAHCHW